MSCPVLEEAPSLAVTPSKVDKRLGTNCVGVRGKAQGHQLSAYGLCPNTYTLLLMTCVDTCQMFYSSVHLTLHVTIDLVFQAEMTWSC